MSEEAPLDTRAKILRAALELFEAGGFHATSIRQIAEQVGVTKTTVLYHFPEKVDLLEALAAPLLQGLEAAVSAADLVKPAAARQAAIEGILEVYLANRMLLRLSLRDMALTAGPVFERFRDALLRANAQVAGPRPGTAELVRAAQAIAMVGDPVVLYAHLPTDALRASVLDGVRRLFGDPPLPTKKPRRGPKSVMGEDAVKTARRLHESGMSADEIARKLEVSRATVYRHLRLK